MMSLSLLPVFKYTITDMAQQERLMTRLMIPLGIADVSCWRCFDGNESKVFG
jgi:hypothetical protein